MLRSRARTQFRDRTNRGGIATLEFVMSLPLIMVVAVVIFGFAAAGLKKSEVVLAARNDAWKKRAGMRISDSLEVSALPDHTVSANPRKPLAAHTGFGTISITAESRTQLLSGTWADPDTHFDESVPQFVPHTDLLGRLTGIGGLMSVIRTFGKVFGRLNSVLGQVGAAIGAVSNLVVEGAGDVLAGFGFVNLYEASRE